MDSPREPLPTRVEETPDAARRPTTTPWTPASSRSARARRRRRATAIDGHARLLLAWTSAINLTSIRDPAAVALAHVVDSLTALRDPARARGRPLHRPRLRRRLSRACPLAAACRRRGSLLLEPIRQEGRLPVHGHRRHRARPTVEAAPVRAEALAADAPPPWPLAGRHRAGGGQPRRARRTGLPAPGAGRRPRRLEARRPRRGAGAPPSGRGRAGRRCIARAAPGRGARARRATAWSIATAGGRSRPPTRAIPAARKRRPW